ncbi:SMI1/KNR4 family protein [Streptomyces syringium]|uniref:SMI1/KNR4 family protein n=1 Tax=Streptomyces syringium TaxID=76729 RepID=UPI0036536561
MTRIDLTAFDTAWNRFASWLSVHSPADHAALQSPATAEEITRLEAQLGFSLHPELRALLERHNGVAEHLTTRESDSFQAGAFLPLGHRLNHTDRNASAHRILVDFGQENTASGLWEEDDLDGHAHQWVPFAHPNDGGVAFIDHRPGPTYATSMRWVSARVTSTARSGLPTPPNCSTAWPAPSKPAHRFKQYWPGTYEHPSGRHGIDWQIRS